MSQFKKVLLTAIFAFCVYDCEVSTTDVPCGLEKDVGPCKSAKPRFFYNQDAKQCEEFIYGGCEGNDNNFLNKESCDNICVTPRGTKVCEMPKCMPGCKVLELNGECGTCVCPNKTACQDEPVSGMCYAAFTKYGYNSTTGKCQEFIYGGCGGNDNNFATLAQCNVVCEVPTETGKNEECKTECPQDCGQETMENGCLQCICSGPFFPVVSDLLPPTTPSNMENEIEKK